MAGRLDPFRLAPWFSERVWGRLDLRPWYASTGTVERVGEAWLTGVASVAETGPLAGKTLGEIATEHPEELLGSGSDGEFPLLVKMLFPDEKLSVQVHPDDAQAQAMGLPRGKTECWYVLEGSAGAAVALGLKPDTSAGQVRAAVADQSLEELLEWVPVSVGDMIFVDAGTVNAIGPGVVLLETQQTSDTTFRLYDYGRPRELHLEDGLRVLKTRTEAGKVAPRQMEGFIRLIEQQYFCVDRYDLSAGGRATVPADRPGCIVCLTGSAVVIGGQAAMVEFIPGHAVVIPVGENAVLVETSAGVSFVRCFAP